MANAILCSNDMVTDASTTVTGSTATSSYSVDNVRVYQPGQSFRSTVLNPAYVDVALPTYKSIDTVAALYTNVTAHHNLLKYSNNWAQTGSQTSGLWYFSNLAGGTDDTDDVPIAGIDHSEPITCSGSSVTHYVAQYQALPASTTYNMWTLSAYVRDTSSAPAVCLEINDNGSEYLRAFFNLAAGSLNSTARSTNTSTDIAASISSVSPVIGSGTWYRIQLTGKITSSLSALEIRLYLCDASYNLTHSEATNAGIAALQLEYFATGAASAATATTYYDEASGNRAAWWNVDTDNTDWPWQPCAACDLTDQDYAHLVAKFTAETVTDSVRINIYDPDNDALYIEVGNAIVGKSFQATYNIDTDWSLGWMEEGSSARALGGQLYRPINKRFRQLAFSHQWLSESEAFDEVYEIDRLVGRSEGVLVVIDPASDYKHQWAVWGVQDGIGDILHRAYVRGLSDRVYSKQWTILEALP